MTKHSSAAVGMAVLAVAIVSGCAASSPGSPPMSTSSASVGQADLSSECPPLDLRGPGGERIDLTGEWTGSGVLVSDSDEVALLKQIGECVFGSVSGYDSDGAVAVTNLTGRLHPDFTIDVQVAIVLQTGIFRFGELSVMDMVLEWDEGSRIRLREVREPGERAQRCVQLTLSCSAPVIWYRTDASP